MPNGYGQRYLPYELEWLKAAATLPKGQVRKALRDIADMTGRPLEALKTKIQRVKTPRKSEAGRKRKRPEPVPTQVFLDRLALEAMKRDLEIRHDGLVPDQGRGKRSCQDIGPVAQS